LAVFHVLFFFLHGAHEEMSVFVDRRFVAAFVVDGPPFLGEPFFKVDCQNGQDVMVRFHDGIEHAVFQFTESENAAEFFRFISHGPAHGKNILHPRLFLMGVDFPSHFEAFLQEIKNLHFFPLFVGKEGAVHPALCLTATFFLKGRRHLFRMKVAGVHHIGHAEELSFPVIRGNAFQPAGAEVIDFINRRQKAGVGAVINKVHGLFPHVWVSKRLISRTSRTAVFDTRRFLRFLSSMEIPP
jgi:hypothetical protein